MGLYLTPPVSCPQKELLCNLSSDNDANDSGAGESVAIKNPAHAIFVCQSYVAHGPQQVDSWTPPRAVEPSRAGNSESPANKLLGQTDGERLDAGVAKAAVRADSSAEVHGIAHASR